MAGDDGVSSPASGGTTQAKVTSRGATVL